MSNVIKKLMKEFPFCEIQTVTDNENIMVYFPKTYVRVEGLGGAGTIWHFNDKPADGYHLHSAFYKFDSYGEEVENGVLHSSFVASKKDGKAVSNGSAIWGGVDYLTAREFAKTAGENYDMLNIYDYHFRGLLMLIETLAMGYDCADVQTAIAEEDGAVDVEHFGIKSIWGGANCGFWIYGLDTSNAFDIKNTNIHILGKYGKMIDTKVLPPGNGYPVAFQTKNTVDYNLGDILLGETMAENYSAGSCGDLQNLDTEGGQAFAASWLTSGNDCGPFHLSGFSPTFTNAARSFALRKAV